MKRVFQVLFCGVLLAVMGTQSACVPPRVNKSGHIDIARYRDMITPGKTVKGDLLNKLGTPSMTSSIGAETWYYVNETKEAVAFLAPDVTQQHVTRITFDEEGVVTEVKTYDKEQGRKVAIAEEQTPTAGAELGFFEQILGNVGRFNPGGQGRGGAVSRGRGRGTPRPGGM
jgi:outer membrane protein assembly factor BamE (lipoprotein component of BamABCDE complex)